ncbi:hypothetical protein CK503_00955 [Aliifodinibius salipaludis]|uniref:Tetratricopeptide repeat protein n=1 Tax=Fodinibius salipaludis TaxID=2032627 RepID=A0A2A2GFJ1_9BACT|nr:DUF5343 domain-containing protein [Aliifodinibius salipaludis]PAU95663.1 hypothetical protein CK503_00955 [Aliifodinibius salipaludis]
MKVSEAFLVNTENFVPIIESLVHYDADDIVINSDLLEHLSYSDPNDLLVIRILKDFAIIDNNGEPGKYFEEFQNPETTKIALAKGLVTAYKGIFDQHPNIHQRSPEKIKEVFQEHFKDKKTDLIIKYILGTFQKIVSHIGVSTIDAVLNDEANKEKVTAEVSASERNENSSSNNGRDQRTNSNEGQEVKKEEISDNSIDDFLNGFETSSPKNRGSDTNNEQSEFTPNPETHQTDDPPIQEFVNSIEESTEEPIETAEEKEKKTKSEELSGTLDEIEENNIEKTEDQDENEDDAFDLGTNGQPEQESNSSESNKKQEPGDIDPIDLELPMSQATKPNNAMQNVTEEHQFVKKALLRKSDLLHKMKRWEELVPTLEEIINRYDNQEHTDLKNAIERAVIRRAIALLKLGKSEEALPALNSVIDRFKDSDNEEFYEQASRAMLFKIDILEKKNIPSDELLPLYNTIINRLDSNSQLLLEEKLDAIHCKRFDLIVDENNTSMLLDASSKLISRFKDSGKHQEYLQKAMIVRAEALDEMGEDEAALKAYDEFLKRFGN